MKQAGTHTFSSPLPPEQLILLLSRQAALPVSSGRTTLRYAIRWRGRRFTLTCVSHSVYTRADGWRREGGRLVRGPSRWKRLSNPFVGEILPNGTGSLLRGSIRPHPLSWLMAAVAAGALLAAVCLPSPDSLQRLAGLALGLWLGWQILRIILHPEDGGKELLAFLRENLEETASARQP